MEIYALCTGKIAHFNEQIKTYNDPTNTLREENDYITLQIIFNSEEVDEFDSNDFSKFILYQASLDSIQAMIPDKIITCVHTDAASGASERIPYVLFKVILKNRANGQLVQMNTEINTDGHKVSTFIRTFAFPPPQAIDSEFAKFISSNGLDIRNFACSTSRVPTGVC